MRFEIISRCCRFDVWKFAKRLVSEMTITEPQWPFAHISLLPTIRVKVSIYLFNLTRNYAFLVLKIQLAEQIGLALGIVRNKASFLGAVYKPTITAVDDTLHVGRAILKKELEMAVTIGR